MSKLEDYQRSADDTIAGPADATGDTILITQCYDDTNEYRQILITRSEARELGLRLLELSQATIN